MMTIEITCPKCSSSIKVYPSVEADKVQCDICDNIETVHFDHGHEKGLLKSCVFCERKDFYKQKDFNRKIGVSLFIVAAILSIWTYGLSFVALYMVDFFLFKKLNQVAICYKCNTNFRGVANLKEITEFNHEMHDRISYSDHDFDGKPLTH